MFYLRNICDSPGQRARKHKKLKTHASVWGCALMRCVCFVSILRTWYQVSSCASIFAFPPPQCTSLLLFSSLQLRVGQVPSLCPCGSAPASLSNAPYCKCRHQKRKPGRACLWPSLLPARDCPRARKGKTRQAETASTLLICHRRCVRSGHVALRACPSRRESLIMKAPECAL